MTMHGHYERERAHQARFEEALATSMPGVDVRDVELDDVAETIRVFIARPDGGVDLELCIEVTRALRDSVPDLAMEVSSPGIDPPLRSSEHFNAAVGSRIRIKQRGVRRSWNGVLEAVTEDGVVVRRENDTLTTIAIDDIARARQLADDAVTPSTTEGIRA